MAVRWRRAASATATAARRFLLQHRKLNLLLYRIYPVHQDPQALPHAVSAAAPLANDLARVLVINVTIIDQSSERNEAFNKQFGELNEKPELGDAHNQAIEVFADPVLHKFCFLPFHHSALGFIGAPFELA